MNLPCPFVRSQIVVRPWWDFVLGGIMLVLGGKQNKQLVGEKILSFGKEQCNVISATQDKKNATQDKSKCPPRTNFPCGLEARN